MRFLGGLKGEITFLRLKADDLMIVLLACLFHSLNMALNAFLSLIVSYQRVAVLSLVSMTRGG